MAELTYAELKAKLEAAEAKIKAQSNHKLSCKVGEKGGVSVYGLGRFPVTLYGEQWAKLIEFMPTLVKFIKDNQDKLTVKAA